MRRTRALPPMPVPQPDALPLLKTPLILRHEDVEHIPEEQRAALPMAQAAWLRRQNTLDPRTPRYSRPITLDELKLAHRIITSLFRIDETPGLTALAAQDWISALYVAIATAEAEGRAAPVALPYLWVAPAKMDVLEAVDRAEAFTPVRRRTRQRRTRMPQQTEPQTEPQTERQRHGRTRTHGSQTSDDSAPHAATERDAAQADASERGQRNKGGKGGRQPRRLAGVAV